MVLDTHRDSKIQSDRGSQGGIVAGGKNYLAGK